MLQLQKNEPLSLHSTIKIGGPALYFTTARDIDGIVEAIDFARSKKLRYFILGLGSNILFADKGFNGVVIKLGMDNIEIAGKNALVDAGMPLQKLLNDLRKNGLTGLEFLAGVPGTLGGAVVMNAGLKELWIGKFVEKVLVIDQNGKENVYSKADCKFNYRTSVFTETSLFIKKVELNLDRDTALNIKEKMQAYMKDRIEKQPYDIPSMGSIFKNPKGQFAGKLLEDAGLKGARIGNAQISSKHANFIVNLGQATCQDVRKLIDLARNRVWGKFRVKLQLEIIMPSYI
ncbi:UDP-N-acetylmuramate dehydrogenase [Candidatus Saganbacteria bacterium]|nr:UDP-N-acetylmuramate dehydrogenase [Candidatus Saganbacteria bacterium]